MTRRNRIDPFGDLHESPYRGLFTGNRGCLVDDNGLLTRHHRGSLWITCVVEYKDWKSPLSAPRHWTPLFFLDEAVALAAGHRPCGLCRRPAYRSYQAAVMLADRSDTLPPAAELNRRLNTERLRPGRGLERATDRLLWRANIADLPAGTVIVDEDSRPLLVLADRLLLFDFVGWTAPRSRPAGGTVTVLTPPTSVAALANGYRPTLHPTAGG